MTEISLLQGEITENPHEQELDVEGLLLRFVRALVAEQAAPDAALTMRVVPPAVAVPRELATAAETKASSSALRAKPVAAAGIGASTALPEKAAVAAASAAAPPVAASSAPASPRALALVRPQITSHVQPQPTGDRS